MTGQRKRNCKSVLKDGDIVAARHAHGVAPGALGHGRGPSMQVRVRAVQLSSDWLTRGPRSDLPRILRTAGRSMKSRDFVD